MKRLLYIFMVFTIILTCTCNNVLIAAVIPRVAITSPSSGTVEVGGSITYTIKIYNGATSVNLKPSDIRITGATANISVEGDGNSQRTVVLSNIQGSVGSVVYISYIAPGVATNAAGGSLEFNGESTSFTIVATVNNTPVQQPEQNNNVLPPANENNNNNNVTTPEEPQEEEVKDEQAPTMEIGELSATSTEIGNEISFEIRYTDDKEMGEITLNSNDLTLYGFKADITITGEGDTRKVTLSNIQGHLGGLKYVKIASNTAKDKAGNIVSQDGNTPMFKVVDNDTKNKPDDWIENPNTGK